MSDSLSTVIRQRYQRICEQVAEAAIRSGRTADSVRLVVVTKSQPLSTIQAALEAGITRLGENYAEEAVEKMQRLAAAGVEWHMIGHVQSRKAALVARHFAMLHSLDSVKLARRLNDFCQQEKRLLPVLLEFNVSGEASKFGFPAWEEAHWPDLLADLEAILALPSLQIRGLMTMPPYFEDPERARPYFRRLRHLQDFLRQRLPQGRWDELSMGTSADFLAAIEEGATWVRVGQAILGPRPPKE
jgi:pyridoxal phosphate enzyme (YggS family)